MISKQKAMTYFLERTLPRRVKEEVEATDKHGNPCGKRTIFRRVGPEEDDRGKLYPLCHVGINTFAHFGIGIGIYFTQLIILTGVCFVCGIIMIAAGNAYTKSTYGVNTPSIPLSAACEITNITATVGCFDGQESCLITYRPNCSMPYIAGAADLAMCFVLACVIMLSKFAEARIEQKLDESVQTVQDYSVEVLDPDHDADDPDEWFEFFSQFGTVVYITILRRNGALTDALLRGHKFSMKLKESGKFGSKLGRKRELYTKEYHKYRNKIFYLVDEFYPVCRVFVTFEHENDQRRCMEALEVPDIEALFDYNYKDSFPAEHRFRGKNILNVREPPEPDNILWQNVEIDRNFVWKKKLLSYFLSLVLMVSFWFIVIYSSETTYALAIIIGVIDTSLPYIMMYITDLITPLSEGTRQSSMQMRLFGARLLLTTLIPYFQATWTDFLSDDFVTQAFTVQITACFTSPIIAFLDLPGLLNRHVFYKCFADTQEEMNSFYNGSEWSLAEKYTGIARVLFVSLFYAVLNPLSLLICSLAFVIMFTVDNFLLLRRWKAASMLDSKIALRLRQQAVLAVAAHMLITMRFIYSWPMDEAYIAKDGTVSKVDKKPPWMFITMRKQVWMTPGQLDIFTPYQICLGIMGIVAVYMWVLEPGYKFFFELFCYNLKPVGKFANIPFSAIPYMNIYYPILNFEEKKYMSSYSKHVQSRHRPVLVESLSLDRDDLSCYVPVQKQAKVLSIIKYFGREGITVDLDEGKSGKGPEGSCRIKKELKKKEKAPRMNPLETVRTALYNTLFFPLELYNERSRRRMKKGRDPRAGEMGAGSQHYGRARGDMEAGEGESNHLLSVLDKEVVELTPRSKPSEKVITPRANSYRVVPSIDPPDFLMKDGEGSVRKNAQGGGAGGMESRESIGVESSAQSAEKEEAEIVEGISHHVTKDVPPPMSPVSQQVTRKTSPRQEEPNK